MQERTSHGQDGGSPLISVFGGSRSNRESWRLTPDGISSDDWDRVRELAGEVVNLSGADRYGASDQVVGGTYDRFDRLPEIRSALVVWSNCVEALVTDERKRGELVAFGRASAASRRASAKRRQAARPVVAR